MKNLLLSFEDVTIRVPGSGVFQNINFQVAKGEHWALVGENEDRKLALVQALAGTAPIVRGVARYPFFQPYKKAFPAAPLLSPHHFIAKIDSRHTFRNLANTSQFYYQQRFNAADSEDAMTVQAYLEQYHATEEPGTKSLQEVVKTLHLSALLDKQLIKLSHGETKRLLMAAALLQEPEILLLVNPFAGLDTATRKGMHDLIQTVATQGVTLILSTTFADLPEVITHVARFKNDQTITCGLRETMQQEEEPHHPETTPLPVKAEALLPRGNHPIFEKMIVMNNVCIQYGEKRILDNINWTIQQGERWAVLGPNGAGKSTLLSLITADNPQAFANDIILFDRKKGSGESIWDIKKKIGFFSPELYQYFPLETACLDAVESGFYDTMGLFRASDPERAALARGWMELFGIEALAGKLLSGVSPVNQRLCLLARAFVKSPPLLILDEPCQGFSHQQLTRFKNILHIICAQSNTTLLYVTHRPEEMPTCVNKVFRLENGKQVNS